MPFGTPMDFPHGLRSPPFGFLGTMKPLRLLGLLTTSLAWLMRSSSPGFCADRLDGWMVGELWLAMAGWMMLDKVGWCWMMLVGYGALVIWLVGWMMLVGWWSMNQPKNNGWTVIKDRQLVHWTLGWLRIKFCHQWLDNSHSWATIEGYSSRNNNNDIPAVSGWIVAGLLLVSVNHQ